MHHQNVSMTSKGLTSCERRSNLNLSQSQLGIDLSLSVHEVQNRKTTATGLPHSKARAEPEPRVATKQMLRTSHDYGSFLYVELLLNMGPPSDPKPTRFSPLHQPTYSRHGRTELLFNRAPSSPSCSATRAGAREKKCDAAQAAANNSRPKHRPWHKHG